MPAMIIVDEIVSADGVAARPEGSIDFFVEREGLVDSVGDAERMSRVRAVLLGAQTYREFSAYWPTREPTLDVNRDGGMTVSVGRLRSCPVLDYKFVALGHNTIRGAAGAAILNAELMHTEGLL